MDIKQFATDNARREFPTSPSRRYCPMCDTWHAAKHKECPECGADTLKQDRAPKQQQPTKEQE